MMVSLTQIASGQSAKVVAIEGGQSCQEKLQNLGFREGIVVKKIRGMFSHGPLIVKAGRAEIALGRGLAERVLVEPID